jgi:hypothetical protein
VDSNFEREPLVRPFGFKGGYMSEIWQTMAYMRSGFCLAFREWRQRLDVCPLGKGPADC